MDTFVVIVVVALAVGYLYKHFSRLFRRKTGVCGCGGCCAAAGGSNAACPHTVTDSTPPDQGVNA